MMNLRTGLILLLTLTTLLATLPARAAKPVIGETAPNFTLPSDGPFNLRLSEQKGFVVVLVFWASGCRSCPVPLKSISAIGQKYRETGVKLWGISLDPQLDDTRHLMKKYDLRFPVLQDADVAVSERYDFDDMPALYVVDRDGKLRYTREGFNPGDDVKLDQFLQTLVHE